MCSSIYGYILYALVFHCYIEFNEKFHFNYFIPRFFVVVIFKGELSFYKVVKMLENQIKIFSVK